MELEVPQHISRQSVSTELLDEGYISKYTPFGVQRMRCVLNEKSKTYFEEKKKYEYREAREMFVKLDDKAKKYLSLLKECKSKTNDGKIILGEKNPLLDRLTIDYLEKIGYVTKRVFNKMGGTDIIVGLTYAGMNYESLEKEYLEKQSLQPIQQFNINTNGNAIFSNGDNNTINQNNGANLTEIEALSKLLIENLPDNLDQEFKEDIVGCFNDISEMLKDQQPKKSLLKMTLEGLKQSYTAVVTVPSILDKLNVFITNVQEFIK